MSSDQVSEPRRLLDVGHIDRMDPQRHEFVPPVGSAEGTDSCWFCGRAEARHWTALPEEAK